MKLLSPILSTMSLFRLFVWSGRRKHNSVGAFTFVSQQHQHQHQHQQHSCSGLRRYATATASASTQSRQASFPSSRFFAPQQHQHQQHQHQHQHSLHHPHRKQQSRLFAQQNVASSFQQDLIQVKQQVDLAMELLEKNQKSATAPDLLQGFVTDLEREQLNPDFWDDVNSARATVVNAQLSEYSRLLARLLQWKQWSGDCQAALEMLQEDKENTIADGGLSVEEQQMLLQELQETTKQLLQDGEKYELELLLSGPYDHAPARIILTAGAGGTEANDWVADLKRMYERHASKMGFTCTIEDFQDGDVVGFKSVDMLITGPRAYGWFQGEKGAHRLVRLSPFNSNNKRQTTFAGVDVAPEVLNEDDLKEITIPDKDIEITTMRSGGSGGQNVNKVDSAVRIKHLPSGLQVKCTQERSQSMNKDIAMRRLKAQLLAIAKEQRVKEIKEIRGDMVEASWGAQIRNYVLHPYKMVKDQRTGWETSNPQAFLDGELLDDCIGAYLRYKVEQEEADQS